MYRCDLFVRTNELVKAQAVVQTHFSAKRKQTRRDIILCICSITGGTIVNRT